MADGMEIDANIEGLVDALNALPGIFTFSSCGGHPGKLSESQTPEGTFYVNFDVDIIRGGWRSLEIIAATIGGNDDADKLTLKVWHDGGPCFELRGVGADPDALGDALEDAADLYDFPSDGDDPEDEAGPASLN